MKRETKKVFTTKQLLKGYFDSIGDSKLWPPVNNYSLFVFGSEYNSKKYLYSKIFSTPERYELLMISDGTSTSVNLSENFFLSCSKEVFSKYLRDPKTLKKYEKHFYANFPLIDKLYAKYTYKKIATENIDTFCRIAGQSLDLIWLSNAWSHFSIYFDKELCWKILLESKVKITREELDDIWDHATIPAFQSFDKEQEYNMFEFLAQGYSLNDVAEKCQYFYTNYKEALSLQEVKKKLQRRFSSIKNSKDAKRALTALKKEEEEKKREYKNWKKQLLPIQQRIADYCQIVMRVRDHRKNFFGKGLAVSWRIAERILREAGIDSKYIQYTLPFQELVKGVEFVKSKKDEIKKRQKGYVAWVMYEGGVQMAYDHIKEAKKTVGEHYLRSHATPHNTKAIKGQIGNKGFVRGIEKIVLDVNRSDHFSVGDILVTGMTRPEFVPLVKRASAIITD